MHDLLCGVTSARGMSIINGAFKNENVFSRTFFTHTNPFWLLRFLFLFSLFAAIASLFFPFAGIVLVCNVRTNHFSGGGIVGFATNWLALKWIFEPVDPMKIGPWIVQGKFLKRQKEVAAEFSRYFSNTILSGEQIWKSILTDPETKPAFTKLFTEHFQAFIHKIPWFLRRPLLPGTMERLAGNIVDQLPKHVPVLFPYMNQALGLEQTLRQRMEKMTSRKFERVLHPIFEEDELTLIIAGAVLGFLAGLVQQGLETGTIKLPNVFGFLRRWIAPRFLKLRLRIRSFFSKGTVGGTGDEDGGDDIIGGPMPMRLFPKKQ